jgi:hypothetical protein
MLRATYMNQIRAGKGADMSPHFISQLLRDAVMCLIVSLQHHIGTYPCTSISVDSFEIHPVDLPHLLL